MGKAHQKFLSLKLSLCEECLHLTGAKPIKNSSLLLLRSWRECLHLIEAKPLKSIL